MLVLTRKQGQGFLLGDNVEITLLEVGNDKVRIAINAPKELSILRSELAEARRSNQEALTESRLGKAEFSALRSLLRQEAPLKPCGDPASKADAPAPETADAPSAK